nr:MAG TPA: hypothetical protein [Siphoviridae sp. ctIyp7]
MYDSCSKCYIFHWRNRQQFFHWETSLRFSKEFAPVEELIGLKYYFKSSDKSYSSGTCNEFIENGYYRYTYKLNDIPSSSDGQIIVFRMKTTNSDYPIVQMAITSGNSFYIRIKWYEKEWTEWKKII